MASLILLAGQVPALAADFVPEQVFDGRSRGEGELRILLGKPRRFSVESIGTQRQDAAFVLRQRVQFEGRPAESRTWVMRRLGPREYTATLTNAAGRVRARVSGSRLTLRYPLNRWGIVMQQTLELANDGRTVANRGRVKLLGLTIGELRETIYLDDRTP